MINNEPLRIVAACSYYFALFLLICLMVFTIIIFQEYEIIKDMSNNNYELYCVSIGLITLTSIEIITWFLFFTNCAFLYMGLFIILSEFAIFAVLRQIDPKNENLTYCFFVTGIICVLYVITLIWIIYATSTKKEN